MQQRTVKHGRRMFAVPKPMGLAERIAARTDQLRGNWGAIERMPKGSRVIINQHR